ncbi:MAG TPA: hypothetical protein VFB12_09870 [Ktedonobacteraceae bacterium]|nr:hypothetical protein [Ktedonobacteraceae bacterium]
MQDKRGCNRTFHRRREAGNEAFSTIHEGIARELDSSVTIPVWSGVN